MKVIDRLIERTVALKSPIVIGLDPVLERIPTVYHEMYQDEGNTRKQAAKIIYHFNQDVIDAVCDLVPAVKPQIAFYEMYGMYGIEAFEKTIQYARDKGLIVIEDGKRNDIGNTARAYAIGHLGKENFDVDFLTVSSYLGKESLDPFVEVANNLDKGIFILVKTSNTGNGEIQDVLNNQQETIAEMLAKYVNDKAKATLGMYGYSGIGAVVGATYPQTARKLRKIMPQSYFLVPGYGTQGGDSDSITACFNPDGLGAIVNASRSVLYGYETSCGMNCSREVYCKEVMNLTKAMQLDIYDSLKSKYPSMKY